MKKKLNEIMALHFLFRLLALLSNLKLLVKRNLYLELHSLLQSLMVSLEWDTKKYQLMGLCRHSIIWWAKNLLINRSSPFGSIGEFAIIFLFFSFYNNYTFIKVLKYYKKTMKNY